MKRILCYGDSNTWGLDPTNHHPLTGMPARFPEEIRWTGVLGMELGPDYRICEEGLCSRTIAHDSPMQPGRNGMETFPVVFETCDPVDLVIIMLGGNDQQMIYGSDGKEIVGLMEKLLWLAKLKIATSCRPEGKILLVNPPRLIRDHTGSYMFMFTEKSEEAAEVLSREFPLLAQATGCEYLDADAIVKAGSRDGAHLDEEGHRILGRALAEKVRNII